MTWIDSVNTGSNLDRQKMHRVSQTVQGPKTGTCVGFKLCLVRILSNKKAKLQLSCSVDLSTFFFVVVSLQRHLNFRKQKWADSVC